MDICYAHQTPNKLIFLKTYLTCLLWIEFMIKHGQHKNVTNRLTKQNGPMSCYKSRERVSPSKYHDFKEKEWWGWWLLSFGTLCRNVLHKWQFVGVDVEASNKHINNDIKLHHHHHSHEECIFFYFFLRAFN